MELNFSEGGGAFFNLLMNIKHGLQINFQIAGG